MIALHPAPDLLVEYTAGSLAVAPCISVTAHLQYCEHCRQTAESLQQIGGRLLMAESAPVSADLLNSALHRIASCPEGSTASTAGIGPRDEIADGLPRFLQRLLPEGRLVWRRLSPSLRVAPISVGEDRYELALHRIKPGGKAPAHDHGGQEITVVLKGSFSDEDGVYQPGDFILRQPGDRHRPFATRNEECICLSVLEAPIRLTGIKRLFNPFLSFSPG